MNPLREAILVAVMLMAPPVAIAVTRDAPAVESSALPARLSGTGLFEPGSTTVLRDGVLPFSPQYPLWSDGSEKRRWIFLPPGTAIDAAAPDAWEFPTGTRLWKEFRQGRAVETRYIERLEDGRWRFAVYVWNEDGLDAVLAPDEGARLEAGPTGRYLVPSRTDCLACHEGPAVPVLGFSALQLSPDRDPLAPHAAPASADHVDLEQLVARRMLVNLPPALQADPPRIDGRTPVERAALGYLHGNCGHCHDPAGALDGLDLALAQRADRRAGSAARTRESLLGRPSRYQPHGWPRAQRVALEPGAASTLPLRLRATSPLVRMPPLGVQIVDDEGIDLVERWVLETQQHHQETGR